MIRDDKRMLMIGLVAAVLGFFSPVIAVQVGFHMYTLLLPCIAVSTVMCLAVLVRGVIPKSMKPKKATYDNRERCWCGGWHSHPSIVDNKKHYSRKQCRRMNRKEGLE